MSYGLPGDLVIGDDGWVEVVGEQSRGGTPQANSLSPLLGGIDKNVAFDILGELVQKSPAFAEYAAKRVAMSRPMTSRTPLQKARDWQIDFGPVCAAAGATSTITVNPQCLFRGEKCMATDNGSPAGTQTRIQTILVGNRLQRPASTNTLTLFFTQLALGNGVKWDTCEKALSIAVTVSFITAVTFDMTVFGKAVL